MSSKKNKQNQLFAIKAITISLIVAYPSLSLASTIISSYDGQYSAVYATDGGTYTGDNVTLHTTGDDNANVVAVYGNSTVTLTNAKIIADGKNAYGVFVTGGGASDGTQYPETTVSIDSSTITTKATAFVAQDNITASISNSTITVTRDSSSTQKSYGIHASDSSIINVSNVNINTTGSGSIAVISDGNSEINIKNDTKTSSLITNSDNTVGVLAENGSSVSINSSNNGTLNIETSGKNSYGLEAYKSSALTSGENSNLNISTTGNAAFGVLSYDDSSASLNDSTITTSGAKSHGVYVADGSSFSLKNGSINTSGENASAIFAHSDKDYENDDNVVNISNSSITSEKSNLIRVNGANLTINLDTVTAYAGNGYILNISGNDDTLGTKASSVDLTVSNSSLNGNIIVDSGNTADIKLTNNSTLTGYSDNATDINIDQTSSWYVTDDSTVSGTITNSGLISFTSPVQGVFKTLTTGSYVGNYGALNINTVLGDDSSATDKLIVDGAATGTTYVTVTNAGGSGAQTVEGIQVVQVDGNSAGTFSLASPVQAGAYEYQLFQGGTSTPTDGDWYLRSHLATVDCKVTNTCTPIYRPGVAGYVAGQTANAHQGFDQLGTLHERMGEQRQVSADGKQTWGRIYHRQESNDGHDRFSYDQNSTGLQIGQDLWVKNDNQAQKHAGVSLSYVHSNADFNDSVRPLAGLEAGTGSMSADSIGLGGYYTHMGDDGRYLDVVGQISHLRNKFTDSYAGKATQTGWRAGLSAEVGKPVAEYKGWKFEPQAQLSYQYTDYGSFNDAISKVEGYDAHTLRGRVGLRVHKDVSYGTDRQAQYYAIGNVIHDFIKPEAVTIGNTTVRENFDRTYWELGAGIQGQVAKNTYVYADARYQQSFHGNQHAGKVNVGIKTRF
jgi:outer membrane autotransporter protein